MKDMRDKFRAWRGLHHTRTIDVDGLSLRIPPGVLDPILFRSGVVLARHLRGVVEPGQRLLDLGCGSGVIGVLTRSAGGEICATDIDPRACEAARLNGIRDVREGDLFEPIRDERFDHVAFNPPYFVGDPETHPLGRALFDGKNFEIIRRYQDQVHEYLRPNGVAWLILSDEEPKATAHLDDHWKTARVESVEGERLRVYRRDRLVTGTG